MNIADDMKREKLGLNKADYEECKMTQPKLLSQRRRDIRDRETAIYEEKTQLLERFKRQIANNRRVKSLDPV